MAAIINARINVANLSKEKLFKGKKGTYYNVTISINDETRFGNNVSIFDSQTKEERESEDKRNYTGNGSVIWTNGQIQVAESQNVTENVTKASTDLPF
tara:strand:- start:4439 stop:4732 length:294 start_codon:yes stop_codon:yes gene_type:complete